MGNVYFNKILNMAAESEMTQTGTTQHIYYISSSKNNKNQNTSTDLHHISLMRTSPHQASKGSWEICTQVVLMYEHFFNLCET